MLALILLVPFLSSTAEASVCSRYKAKDQAFACKLNPCCNYVKTSMTKRVIMGKTYKVRHWKCEPMLTSFCQKDGGRSSDEKICRPSRDNKPLDEGNLTEVKEMDDALTEFAADETASEDPVEVVSPLKASQIGFFVDTGRLMTKRKCESHTTDISCLEFAVDLQVKDQIRGLTQDQHFNVFLTDGPDQIQPWMAHPVPATAANKNAAIQFLAHAAQAPSDHPASKTASSLKKMMGEQKLGTAVVIGTGDVIGLQKGLRDELSSKRRGFSLVFVPFGAKPESWREGILNAENQEDWGAVMTLFQMNAPSELHVFPDDWKTGSR